MRLGKPRHETWATSRMALACDKGMTVSTGRPSSRRQLPNRFMHSRKHTDARVGLPLLPRINHAFQRPPSVKACWKSSEYLDRMASTPKQTSFATRKMSGRGGGRGPKQCKVGMAPSIYMTLGVLCWQGQTLVCGSSSVTGDYGVSRSGKNNNLGG